MTNKMFEKPGEAMSGSDIAARNIQRGRDHGMPGYQAWRNYCGLEDIAFDDIDGSLGTSK